MKSTVNEVPCPCCKELLFKSAAIAAGVPVKTQGPELKQDASGPYMLCPHCGKRIAFVSVPTPQGAPIQWRVSDIQACK